jgi:hypothetical protein
VNRGKGLRRNKPLRSGPGPKPTSVEADRARQRELERAIRPPKPIRRARRNPLARGWTQRVFALYGRYCLRCSTKQKPVRAVQAHHAIPRQAIEDAPHLTPEERLALEYDARNGVPLCLRCHDDSPSSRLRRSQLPRDVIEWAREHGFEGRLDRIYGPGGR